MNQNSNNQYGKSASGASNRSAKRGQSIWRGVLLLGVIVFFLLANWNRIEQNKKSPSVSRPVAEHSMVKTDDYTFETERKQENRQPITAGNTNHPDSNSDPRLANAREIASQYLAKHGKAVIKGPVGEEINLTPLLKRIAEGKIDSHRNDGSEFYNRERKLPQRSGRYYTEFVDRDDGSRSPGAKRLIIGQTGDIWYTLDHYQSFVKVGE